MKASFRAIFTKSLNRKIKRFPKPADVPAPSGGWVRAIRLATGMPANYAARKLKVTRQGFAELEKSEAAGTISLKSLQRAGDALNCQLVYALVPRNGSLGKLIIERAVARARKTLQPVSHSMSLESQGTKPGPKVRELAKKLAAQPNRKLWME
jgi:predicted DNA-binding mobile mystery protein A